MAKRKARFSSLSTPGHKQDCSNYLVELAFLRWNRGTKLPEYFWRQQRYKWKYGKEIKACRKFIKKYGEAAVLYIALNNYITTWQDFAHIEFLLQKIEERRQRIATPKDTSPVSPAHVPTKEDLRDFVPAPRKKGLFERLKELNSGEEEISGDSSTDRSDATADC